MIYMATSINQSATIVEKAGAAIEDVRGKALKYDDNGNVVLAAAGEMSVGIGIMTNFVDIKADEDVDIQVKDIGLVLAGAEFKKGAELAADADGKLIEATEGQYVVAIAMEAAPAADAFIKAQLTKYVK